MFARSLEMTMERWRDIAVVANGSKLGFINIMVMKDTGKIETRPSLLDTSGS